MQLYQKNFFFHENFSDGFKGSFSILKIKMMDWRDVLAGKVMALPITRTELDPQYPCQSD